MNDRKPAMWPIGARKESEDKMAMVVRVREDGHALMWEWTADELRAASTALAALAEQLDEPRRNAGPGCTFTRENALFFAGLSSHNPNPVAYIGDGCCVVGYAGEQLYHGKTWWEASAKAGLFGSEIARRMRDPDG